MEEEEDQGAKSSNGSVSGESENEDIDDYNDGQVKDDSEDSMICQRA